MMDGFTYLVKRPWLDDGWVADEVERALEVQTKFCPGHQRPDIMVIVVVIGGVLTEQ